jgi:beta-glucanase (GH16 family)
VYLTLLPLSLFVSSQAFAVLVTFSVDMTDVPLNGQTVRVAGGFGGGCNWDATCNHMTKNPDSDIWTTQIDLSSGNYDYLFVIGNWIEREDVPSSCSNQFNNRNFAQFSNSNFELPTTPFNSCHGYGTNYRITSLPVDNNKQPIDPIKWHHQTQLPNGWGWYNDEQQHYTNELENSYTSNGTLKIVAKKESYTNNNVTKEYTSARLNSKFAFKYGKVEFRAKMPTGVGTWPAVWMLNKNVNEPGGYFYDDFATTNWPAAGEIDILEHWGKDPFYAQSAMHTTASHGGTVNHGGQHIPTIFSEFHTYSMDWNDDRIIFSVDGVEHYRYVNPTPWWSNSPDPDYWPYDDEFYLLLNIAIEKPEVTDSNLNFALMEVDYIRVYHHETNALIWSDEFDSDGNSSPPTGSIIALPVDFEEAVDEYEISDFNGGIATIEAAPDGNLALKYVKGTGQNWAGVWINLETAVDAADGHFMTADVYSTVARDITFKFDDANVERDASHTGSGWETLTFDFTNAVPANQKKIAFFNELSQPGDGSDAWTIYIDNIDQTASSLDSDDDGVADDADAFPNDPSETTDSDNDGTGDNADAFPNDASETTDSDNDGTGDNADAFPNDASETTDTDNDGTGDNTDAFPNDASETTDSDNDGTGDNTDAFPNDASETTDSDNDGTGDNADDFPNDASETTDTDNDGVGDNADYAPNDPTVQSAPTPEQQISVVGTTIASRGGSFSLEISYDVSSNENQLSGLGLRIHYDSTKLEFTGVNNPLLTDKIVNTYSSEMDFDDLDANSATDSYVTIAWASINGTWPNIELPASLLSISFNVRNHVAFNNSEMTTIGFSASSSSQGYNFSATDYDIQILPMNWDFDSNGTADALTDGLLLLRHAFGIAGSSLTDDAIATDSQMSTAEVEDALDRALMIADIDSSGQVDALTDGLLLLRYLFGIREDTLIANAVSTEASRTSHSDISDYIADYMPRCGNAW